MFTAYIESQTMVAMATSLRTSKSAMSYRIAWPRKPTPKSNNMSLAIIQPKL